MFNQHRIIFKLINPNISIKSFCDIMTNESVGDYLTRYAKVNEINLNFFNQDCLSVSYDSMIDFYKNSVFNSSDNDGSKSII